MPIGMDKISPKVAQNASEASAQFSSAHMNDSKVPTNLKHCFTEYYGGVSARVRDVKKGNRAICPVSLIENSSTFTSRNSRLSY